jgi:hypothetical protein
MKNVSLAQMMLHEFRNSLLTPADERTVQLSKHAEEFAAFIDAYLKENPPALIGHNVHANYTITLTNQRQFLLAPDSGDPDGSLPNSAWAPVLGARDNSSRLPESGAVPITGVNR